MLQTWIYPTASHRRVRKLGTNEVPMASQVTANRHAELAHARMFFANVRGKSATSKFDEIMHDAPLESAT